MTGSIYSQICQRGTKWLPVLSVYLYAVPNRAVRDNINKTVPPFGVSRNYNMFPTVYKFKTCQLFSWQLQYGKSLGQHGIFIKQLAEPGSRVFVQTSVVLSVYLLTCTKFTLWLQLQIRGNKSKWKGLCASVRGKAVSTQPICESQTLCNSLPLSRERMYLSNHLNYYNYCWDGSAWISALTLWNFHGPESMPRWVLVSLQNRIMLWEMSLSKLMELNQNQQTEVGPGCLS